MGFNSSERYVWRVQGENQSELLIKSITKASGEGWLHGHATSFSYQLSIYLIINSTSVSWRSRSDFAFVASSYISVIMTGPLSLIGPVLKGGSRAVSPCQQTVASSGPATFVVVDKITENFNECAYWKTV